MEKARYGNVKGELVDPLEFMARATSKYKEKGIFPYCDACQEIVDVYGAHTPNPKVTPRFDHANLPADADPLDDCILANRTQRFRGLGPDGFDDVRGKRMRAEFSERDFLAKAYAFCLNLCRKGNLPAAKFRSMLQRADRKRVWAYADVRIWAIPYILLTLENFSATAKENRRAYDFHFVFQKPRGTNISALWTTAQCQISKVFSGGTAIRAEDNPYPISEVAFLRKAGDTDWISADFVRSLMP
jgi:hypothetical protein